MKRVPVLLPPLATLILMLVPGCDQPRPDRLNGYVEGEYIHVAAPRAGTLTGLNVRRGDVAQQGDALFALDATVEVAAREQAARHVEQAQAILQDLRQGQRPSEVAALQAQHDRYAAQLVYSQSEFTRIQQLHRTQNATQAELDQARARRDQDRADVAEVAARLQTARLGARDKVIAAAEADLQARQAALRRAEWDLEQMRQSAPASGVIFDTLFRPGEQVAANRPVVMLLPPGNIKVRTFVAEPRVGRVHVGAVVGISADGVPDLLRGTVRYISPVAEYTPPVIYSKDRRDKLVYLVEISLEPADAVKLRPGQPVDVELSP